MSFAGVETLIGSSKTDTLVGADVASTWNITGTNAGQVGGLNFSSVENLTGGTADDTFKFGSARSVSGQVDGGAGSNTLDYAAYTTAVSVNLTAGTATAVAGGIRNIANVTGGSGNDNLVGDALDNILIGNAGNDTLFGGAGGNDILVGGAGNDVLTAGAHRSLLIGGLGTDWLGGGASDDLLIGGYTSYDANVTALRAVMSEWKRVDQTYQQRIDHLRGASAGGLNGSLFLNSTTVKDDGTADSLAGGLGTDWFWANLGEISDLLVSERVN